MGGRRARAHKQTSKHIDGGYMSGDDCRCWRCRQYRFLIDWKLTAVVTISVAGYSVLCCGIRNWLLSMAESRSKVAVALSVVDVKVRVALQLGRPSLQGPPEGQTPHTSA